MEALASKFDNAVAEQTAALSLTMQSVDEMIALFERTRECVVAEMDGPVGEASGAMEVDGAEAVAGNGGRESNSASATAMIMELGAKAKKLGLKSCATHKKLHSVYATLGKGVDKQCEQIESLDSLLPRSAFSQKQDLLDQAIANHFDRIGHCKWSESMAAESNKPMKDDTNRNDSQFFVSLSRVLGHLDQHDVGSALQWCDEKNEELEVRNSKLKFTLHRQRFVHLLETTSPQVCVQYATEHLRQFIGKHDSEFQKLMGALMFCGRLRSSPYAALADQRHWEVAKTSFANEFCRLAGLATQSPLAVSIEAGCEALPTLIKYKKVSSLAGQTEWTTKEEMPVEIPLDPKLRFHSIFCCPVGKEQSSSKNPPMMLPCGHVLGHTSLVQLTKRSKVKCPYCPRESKAQECKKVQF